MLKSNCSHGDEVLWLIKGVNWSNRLRNEENYKEKLGVKSLLQYIEESQLRRYGQVKRMRGDRLPIQTLKWQPSTLQPHGRRERDRWTTSRKPSNRKECWCRTSKGLDYSWIKEHGEATMQTHDKSKLQQGTFVIFTRQAKNKIAECIHLCNSDKMFNMTFFVKEQ